MKYMGCVTDREFNRALLEVYPDRRPNSADSHKRRILVKQSTDLRELIEESIKHEARRYYES